MNDTRPFIADLDFPFDAIPVLRPDGSIRSLAEMNHAMIDYVIQISGSMTAAASALGISRSTLYRHLDGVRLKTR